VKRLRPGRIRRRLPLKAVWNRRMCVRVAIIGTSSGPGWAAICRERKPDPRPASNNFLEIGYNFLDFVGMIRLSRWFVDVRFSRIGLNCTVLLFISAHCLFNHRDKGGHIDSESRKQVAHRLDDGGCTGDRYGEERRGSTLGSGGEEADQP
jgi:hypothetical protein